MSLYGLRLAMDYQREQDAALDRYEYSQSQKRKKLLSEEEIEKRGLVLYEKVLNAIPKYVKAQGKGFRSIVPLKTHPLSVVKFVIDKLKEEKKILAKHSYNEHSPSYDNLVIDLKKLYV